MPNVGGTLVYRWGNTGINNEFAFKREGIMDVKEENKLQKITKSPYEKIPVKFNFINNLGALEQVLSYTSTCINTSTGVSTKATIINTDSILAGGTVVSVVVQAGTIGEKHKITVTATTNFGNILEYDCILDVADDLTSSFRKQSGEKKVIQNDFTPVLGTGDSINTFVVSATKMSDGTTASITSFSTKSSPYILTTVSSGISREKYHIRIRIVSTLGYQYEKSVVMEVEDI